MNGALGAAAYSNPYSAAAMAAGQALSSLFGGPGGPQTSLNAPFNPFTVDNSGWSVNFAGNGGARATASPVSTLAQGLAGGVSNMTSAFGDPLVLLAVLALVMVMRK